MQATTEHSYASLTLDKMCEALDDLRLTLPTFQTGKWFVASYADVLILPFVRVTYDGIGHIEAHAIIISGPEMLLPNEEIHFILDTRLNALKDSLHTQGRL